MMKACHPFFILLMPSTSQKIKDFFKQTTKWERITSAIGALVGIPLVYFQKDFIDAGHFRFFTILITFAYFAAALVSARLLYEKLVEKAKDDDLGVLKASWKTQAEYLSLIALLGFGTAQYRVGLDIDKITTNPIIVDPAWLTVVQAVALIGLLLTATLAIARKLALAKFDHFEATEKFNKLQAEKARALAAAAAASTAAEASQ